MKYTKDAIRFGLKNLSVTPNKLKALIESSNGYDGDDYSRWMANQIIQIAEKDGVPYTQLLAKWFNIMQSIVEDCADLSIKGNWLNKLFCNGAYDYYYGAESTDERFGTQLVDIKWFNGSDMMWNTEFLDNELPPEIGSNLHNLKPVNLFMQLGFVKDSCNIKNSSLYVEAKNAGIVCTNEAALMLYRLASLTMALGVEGPVSLSVGLLMPASFFYKVENKDVISYFLNHFSYQADNSFSINSMDLYTDAFTNEDIVFLYCVPRTTSLQDGVVLPKKSCNQSGIEVNAGRFRYSPSSSSEYTRLSKYIDTCVEVGYALTADLKKMSLKGKINRAAFGYLCINSSMRVPILTTVPVVGTTSIPIIPENLWDIVAYYGIKSSLHGTNCSTSINEFITGHSEYIELVHNCLPIFLFDVETQFRAYTVKGDEVMNHFDLLQTGDGYIANKMISEAEIHFSYEAKELMEICKGFLKFLQDAGEAMNGKTFDVVRKECDDRDLNKTYLTALMRCKDYISTQYRRMIGE